MKFLTRMKGSNQQGFTLIELLVVIAILGVLVAVAIPAYSRFFGAGEDEANDAELSHIQAAMDAMMAHHRLLIVDENTRATEYFDSFPTAAGTVGNYDFSTGTVDDPNADYEYLYPAFLRIGNGDNGNGQPLSPTKMCYTWNATGFVSQLPRDPDGTCP